MWTEKYYSVVEFLPDYSSVEDLSKRLAFTEYRLYTRPRLKGAKRSFNVTEILSPLGLNLAVYSDAISPSGLTTQLIRASPRGHSLASNLSPPGLQEEVRS